jgi:cell pole-organizing protein PopZ
MSSSANPQHEPTMEEILASIRKIISEDQTDGVKPAPEPTEVRAAAAESQPHESDVLELTEEVPEEEVFETPAAEVQVPIENDIAFENIQAEPKAEPAMDTDDLISDSAHSAVVRAFGKLEVEASRPPPPSPSGGTLDGLFTKAVQEAFSPTLQEWVDNHHAQIMDSLKPVIRDWMDANLPNLIEAAVTKEISRAAAERSRRR